VAPSDSEQPGSIDFADATQVHRWIAQTVHQRAWQPRLFAAIAEALNEAFNRTIDVVEYGCGAGHLAREILGSCRVLSYTAVDSSVVQHDTARKSLGDAAGRVRFIVADPHAPDWTDRLPPVDAVLAMPALDNRLSHDRRPSLFSRIREILRPEGLLLYCDQYRQDGMQDHDPRPHRDELPNLLRSAGFHRFEELMELGGMVLVRAVA
jgi:cyclopropane fatty-acyl-phospholipid synthase-like methyltransferase